MTTTASLIRSYWFLFLVSFFEGGAVMAVELVGAKMVAPYFGGSLYVWSAVLALTLGGLAAGYFMGGIVSGKTFREISLFGILLVSGILVAFMPITAPLIMEACLDLDLRLGILISCLVFLFPPLVLFGMVSPIIIRLVSSHESRIGHAAGTVYTISTIGGICVTFFIAFYSIPYLGLKASAMMTAAILVFFPLVYFLGYGRKRALRVSHSLE